MGGMDRALPVDMAIITAASRVMWLEVTATVTEDRMGATSGMGLRVGVKGTLPTSPTPNTDNVNISKKGASWHNWVGLIAGKRGE